MVDYRNPRFDSPRYMLELMCRYRQVLRTPRWQLLERGASRCGAPQTIATRRLRLSQRSAVSPPTPDSILVAEFRDFSLPLTDRLSKLVFKRRVQFVWLGTVLNRFIPGHAQNPHVMTVPRCLGWSRTLFDSQPYRRLAIGHMPELTRPNETESGSYQVVFRRIPFACGSAGGAGYP